jgi:hypothetical protein
MNDDLSERHYFTFDVEFRPPYPTRWDEFGPHALLTELAPVMRGAGVEVLAWSIDSSARVERLQAVADAVRAAAKRLYPIAVRLQLIEVEPDWEDARKDAERIVREVQNALAAALDGSLGGDDER